MTQKPTVTQLLPAETVDVDDLQDHWDYIYEPSAAELLDGVLLDEERNALGRQRIAHLREELRNYDRKQSKWDLRTTR
jgi:F0F1-type ATP synthase gamma subunit